MKCPHCGQEVILKSSSKLLKPKPEVKTRQNPTKRVVAIKPKITKPKES